MANKIVSYLEREYDRLEQLLSSEHFSTAEGIDIGRMARLRSAVRDHLASWRSDMGQRLS